MRRILEVVLRALPDQLKVIFIVLPHRFLDEFTLAHQHHRRVLPLFFRLELLLYFQKITSGQLLLFFVVIDENDVCSGGCGELTLHSPKQFVSRLVPYVRGVTLVFDST